MPDQGLQRLSASISAAYDKDSQELTVEFENGRSYTYSGIPPDVWEGLVKSGSAGRYFNTRIRGVY